MSKANKKLGVFGLTIIVLSAMIGGGIFDLPQNMAVNAGLIGQIAGWAVSGIIIWFIVKSFLILSDIRPNLTNGIYEYAEQGFGKFTGFFVSWGYWICECFANITYAVLLMSTLNAFFPGVFTNGNNVNSIIVSTIILWAMSLLILRGIQGATWFDTLGTIIMLVSVVVFFVTMIVAFNWKTFTTNTMATQQIASLSDKNMGNLFSQIKHTMMVSLWVFGGVEGAVVLSDQAKSQKDVRKGTEFGFIISLVLYALASILPLGFKSYGQLAKMANPSMGELTALVTGPIGRIVIAIGVIAAVATSWLTWTLMLSEMPRYAAESGTFPKAFKKVNKKNIPSFSLIVSTLVMQVILISTIFADNAFNMMLTIVGTMTVPPYLISMMYLFKESLSNKTFNPDKNRTTATRKGALITSTLAIIGTIYMGYSAGIFYTTLSFVIYAVGIPFFMYSRHDYDPDNPIFTKYEKIFAIVVVIVALAGLAYLFLVK